MIVNSQSGIDESLKPQIVGSSALGEYRINLVGLLDNPLSRMDVGSSDFSQNSDNGLAWLDSRVNQEHKLSTFLSVWDHSINPCLLSVDSSRQPISDSNWVRRLQATVSAIATLLI